MLNKRKKNRSPSGSQAVKIQFSEYVNNNVYKIVNTLLLYKYIGTIVVSRGV